MNSVFEMTGSICSKMRFLPDIERFEAKYIPVTETGCWIWIGALAGKESHPYGMFAISEAAKKKMTMVRAHRWSYEYYKETIPSGMVIDHKCRQTLCVNPEHLHVVTLRENAIYNSFGASAKNFAKTHCKLGHLLEEKPKVSASNKRRARCCKVCKRNSDNLHYMRKITKSASKTGETK